MNNNEIKILYYKKPIIGSIHRNNEESQPIQIINSDGSISLGLPIHNRSQNTIDPRFEIGGIASTPEKNSSDVSYRRGIKIIFIFLFIINIVVTSLLYYYSSIVDLSKVEKDSGIAFVFSEISQTRSYNENIAFGFTILILIIGFISTLFDNTLGISVFVYAILMNFILGTQALPYYIYSYRYLLDFFMVYIGLVYRSKLMVAFFLINFPAN